jgi:hypothetical protein
MGGGKQKFGRTSPTLLPSSRVEQHCISLHGFCTYNLTVQPDNLLFIYNCIYNNSFYNITLHYSLYNKMFYCLHMYISISNLMEIGSLRIPNLKTNHFITKYEILSGLWDYILTTFTIILKRVAVIVIINQLLANDVGFNLRGIAYIKGTAHYIQHPI